MKVSEKNKEPEDVKVVILLHLIWDEGVDIHCTFHENTEKTLEDLIKEFDKYFIPKLNTTMEAYKFNSIVQQEGQSFDAVHTELKMQAEHSEFKWSSCENSYAQCLITG